MIRQEQSEKPIFIYNLGSRIIFFFFTNFPNNDFQIIKPQFVKFLIPQANICVQVTVLGARDIQVDKTEKISSLLELTFQMG